MEMAHSLKAGFFGGQGFVLQRITGEGDVFVKAGGALIRRELAPGEVGVCVCAGKRFAWV